MERLTLDEAIRYIKEVVQKNRKNKEKHTIIIPNSFISSNDCAEKYEQVANWLEELKSYKDIGTLKELKELKENGAFTGLELAKLAIMQKELKKYKDLEEQGLLVRLPDDLNRVLYQINYRWTKCTKYGERKNKCEIYSCERECDSREEYYIAKVDLRYIQIGNYYDRLGKFLFFTREEAEKKLGEMKNGL